MNTNLVSTKKLAVKINKAFKDMERAKKDYIFSVINLGEILLETKQSVGFGKWESFVNLNSELRFGPAQASKYMQIASHRALVLCLFGNQDIKPSINQLTKAISAAKAQEPVSAEIEAKPVNDDDAAINVAMVDSPPIAGKDGQEDVIEGEFIEAPLETQLEAAPSPTLSPPQLEPDPEPLTEQNELEELWDLVHELQSQVDELAKENEQMRVIFEDDNHTAAAIKEINKLQELNRVLTERNNGLMSEKNQAIKSVKFWKRKAEALDKKLGAGNE
jgi:hypothetical protein